MRISSTTSVLINFMQILSHQRFEILGEDEKKAAQDDFMKICLSLKCHENGAVIIFKFDSSSTFHQNFTRLLSDECLSSSSS